MKSIQENLCGAISNLNVIYKTLNSIRNEMEITTPRLPVEEYFKFLLASERIREGIEIFEEMIEKQKSVAATRVWKKPLRNMSLHPYVTPMD